MRLIDADKIPFYTEHVTYGHGDFGEREVTCRGNINNMPTIDAEPVVHAHWIIDDEKLDDICCECSRCKKTVYYEECDSGFKPDNYCPHCGAKMDEEV